MGRQKAKKHPIHNGKSDEDYVSEIMTIKDKLLKINHKVNDDVITNLSEKRKYLYTLEQTAKELENINIRNEKPVIKQYHDQKNALLKKISDYQNMLSMYNNNTALHKKKLKELIGSLSEQLLQKERYDYYLGA